MHIQHSLSVLSQSLLVLCVAIALKSRSKHHITDVPNGSGDAPPDSQDWIIRFNGYVPYNESRAFVEHALLNSPDPQRTPTRGGHEVLSALPDFRHAFDNVATDAPGCSTVLFVERDNLIARENMMTDFAVVRATGLGAEEILRCVQRGDNGRGDRITTVKDVWVDAEVRGLQEVGARKRRPGRLTTRWPDEIDAIEQVDGIENIGLHRTGRRLEKDADRLLVERLRPETMWELGYSGQGIRMGIFDTGIKGDHPDIDNIVERSNWTHQKSLADGLGHGSFVAGVIASHHPDCPGLAPNVSIHTFKVFTDDQVSFTSWFLDAFNYAIATKIDIVNLSIGGPDYMDVPFVEKVMEATSSGMVMTSAIGNDGPTYGTMNNPADQNDVIGVGGVTYGDVMAGFSSRGMTTWELNAGYGRAKPDVVTYGSSVRGSTIPGGCKSMSGTSFSAPITAGALCLLASSIPEEKRQDVLNPAAMKQVLVEGADRVLGANMFEQGQGMMNIQRSYELLKEYEPRASVVPAVLDMTEAACPYAWPFCTQPLYANAMPTIFNATVLNGMGVDGRITGVRWTPAEGNEAGSLVDIRFEYSEQLWPWSGYLALFLRVRPEGSEFKGVAEGTVTVDVESPPALGERAGVLRRSTAKMQVKFDIIPTPPRHKRVLWDQFHSIKYPPSYIPRDDLSNNADILDWHGDHPHTNFHTLYDTLRHEGYFLEVLGSPFTCFDAEQYGTLLIVDSEEEFYEEEISKLAADVRDTGLGLAVFADWYDKDTIAKMRFYDDNTRTWWDAVTGGAHVPALNDLLRPLDAAFAGGAHRMPVWAPDGTKFDMASGSSIAAMPAGSHILFAEDAETKTTNAAGKRVPRDVPVIGLATVGMGRIALYGDSNCLDSAYRRSSCESFAVSVVRYLAEGDDTMLSHQSLQPHETAFGGFDGLPERLTGIDYAKVSRVLQKPLTCYSNSLVATGVKDGEVREDSVIGDVPAVPPVATPVVEVRVGNDDDYVHDDYISSSISPKDVFDANLKDGVGVTDPDPKIGFEVSRELALAAVAFALLFLLGCARWNRRARRNGYRRPGSAAAERLPILAEARDGARGRTSGNSRGVS